MRQKFGQNFLSDAGVAKRIVDTANPGPEDTVLEIGPGKGAITSMLAARAKRLVAVEIDRELAPRLRERFRDRPHVEIVEGNVLDYDFAQLGDTVKVVANLPYYISTAIIERILPHRNWTTMTVMVQKEVAERVTAEPDTRDYGWFTLLCQYYASARLDFLVGPKSFTPPPKVESAVITLTNNLPAAPEPHLFPLIRTAFAQRRKTILNALTNTPRRPPKDKVLAALAEAGIDPMLRAEDITLDRYRELAARIQVHKLDI